MRRDRASWKRRPRPRVLVVCDDVPTARLLTRGLQEASFAAETGGHDDLDLTAVGRYAALVLVGPQALVLCREARLQRVDARIVAVSPGSRFAAGAATDAGADGVMFDPISVSHLVAQLRRLLTEGAKPSRA